MGMSKIGNVLRNAKAIIRQYRSIPKGSIICIEIMGQEYETLELEDGYTKSFFGEKHIEVLMDVPSGNFFKRYRFSASLDDLYRERVIVGSINYRRLAIGKLGIDKVEKAEQLVIDYTKRLLSEFDFINPGNISPVVNPKWRKGLSNGSSKIINISLGSIFFNHGDVFDEYYRIKADPEIGSFVPTNKDHFIKAIVAHEVAHFLQHNVNHLTNIETSLNFKRPHGNGWQYLYRLLRRSLNQEMKLECPA